MEAIWAPQFEISTKGQYFEMKFWGSKLETNHKNTDFDNH